MEQIIQKAKNLFGHRVQCYCAFCKSPRKVYTKRRVNFFNILSSALGTFVITYVIWQEFDPKGLLFFVTFLAMAEAFIQLRWRINIVCRHCGFDPVLYLKNPDLAAVKVRDFLEKRKSDPATLLLPPLDLPKVSAKKAEELAQQAKAGKFLSKQV